MAFGTFSPLPLRLDSSTLTAAEFLRLASDVASIRNTAPMAIVRTGSGYPYNAVTHYYGRNGVGLGHAPTISLASPGIRLTWPATYENELGEDVPWNFTHVEVFPGYYAYPYKAVSTGVVEAPNVVLAKTQIAATGVELDDAALTFVVYGKSDASIEDYGGSLDKENCQTERTPYAAQFYRLIQDTQGSAYSKELSGLNHVRNLAKARHYGWAQRIIEKWRNEQTPSTSSAKLDDWCALLKVGKRASDSDAERRARATAAYRALNGATVTNVDDAISALLGSWYVKTWRNWNNSMTEATVTYGPSAAGPSQWDLGGGVWASEHAHLVIETLEPTDAERGEFLTLVNVDLRQMLDRMLPDHMTWEWATNVADGFRLDLGHLDYEGMGGT